MICNYDNNNNNNSDVCGGEEDDSAENDGNGHCGGEDIRIGITGKEEENTIQVFSFIFIIYNSSSYQ